MPMIERVGDLVRLTRGPLFFHDMRTRQPVRLWPDDALLVVQIVRHDYLSTHFMLLSPGGAVVQLSAHMLPALARVARFKDAIECTDG